MAPTGKMTNIAPGRGGSKRDPKTLSNHRFFTPSLSAMLRRSLAIKIATHMDPEGLEVAIDLRAHDVGHRVPTGFVDRNLLLVVEAFDAGGRLLRARAGAALPRSAGKDFAGLSGKIYAKQLQAFEGNYLVPFWRARPDFFDTRLLPEQTDRIAFVFPNQIRRIRVRLIYRRFWPETAEEKKWPDNEIIITNRELDINIVEEK